MTVYLAHNFQAREWLPALVSRIEKLGHHCTSTWIFDDAHSKTGSAIESAKVDLRDIDRSGILVLFTDNYGDRPGKGKYFELGYAFAQGKRIILVGEDTGCVFYHIPGIDRVKYEDDLITLLKEII